MPQGESASLSREVLATAWLLLPRIAGSLGAVRPFSASSGYLLGMHPMARRT